MRCSNHSQKGVALLLALGFLSLLLLTGIAFVTNAIIARKAAENANARAQARTLANAAVSRLLTGIRYTLNPGAGAPANLTTPDKMTSVQWSASTEFSGANDTNRTLRGDNSLLTAWVFGEKYIPDNIYTDSNLRPEWEFWYNKYNPSAEPDNSVANDPAKIIGRTAFMALPPTASVNFSEVLRGAPFATDTGTWSKWDARRGASMRELYLGPAGTDLTQLSQRFAAERFDDKSESQDLATEATRVDNYPDYDAIFNAANWNDTSDPGGSKRNWLRAWMLPGGYNEPEIFAYNGSGGSQTVYNDKTTFYHRFNLDRRLKDTGTSVWDAAAGTNRITLDQLLGNPVKFSAKEPVAEPSKALPWLKSITGDAGSLDVDYTVEVLRKQVAANLMDYSDSDQEVTSDSTNWETDAPTYTGHEKTPYINEIMIGITGTTTRTDTKTTSGEPPTSVLKMTCNTDIALRNITVELINLYNNTTTGFNQTANLRIKGMAVLKVIPYTGATAKTVTLAFDTGINGQDLTLTQVGNYAYATLDTTTLTCNLHEGEGTSGTIIPSATGIEWAETDLADENASLEPKIELEQLTIDKTYLTYDGKKADYVRTLEQKRTDPAISLLDATISVPPEAFPAGSTSSRETEATVHFFAGFAVDDPRMNLYQKTGSVIHWTDLRLLDNDAEAKDPTLIRGTTEAAEKFSIAAKNENCTPNAAGTDAEGFAANADPANPDFPNGAMLSTAFIADKPMVSLTELGVIHRGEKWRTINLKCCSARVWDALYDPTRSAADAGGYTYINGDAAILDQVKLTHECFTAGKINLNRYPTENSKNFLFKALFENIGYNIQTPNQYKSTEVGTPRVTPEQAGVLRDVLGASGRASSTPLLSRGHMVDFLKNTAGFIQGTTDVQKEVIPAVSSGLTSCYATSPDIIQYVILAQAIRDVGTPGSGFNMVKMDANGDPQNMDVIKGRFDYHNSGVYFDEITAEVKLLVTVQIDEANNTVRLLKTEFID